MRMRTSNGSDARTRSRLLSAIMTCLPRAWFSPSARELVSLYKTRYRMAMDERKYDAAIVFLDRILEVDPQNLEAKYLKGEIFHRFMRDFDRALDQYRKVIRLSPSSDAIHERASRSLDELLAGVCTSSIQPATC